MAKGKISRKELTDRSMETLKKTSGWLDLWEWTDLIYAEHPHIAKAMDDRASNWKKDVTGKRVLWGELQGITRGNQNQPKNIMVDNSGIKKVKHFSDQELVELEAKEEEEEQDYLSRKDIEKRDLESMGDDDTYRLNEFFAIRNSLNSYFNMDFEVDHAHAIMNTSQPGKHHPDNLQILTKRVNGIKNKSSWKRFTFEEQNKHIRQSVKNHLDLKVQMGIIGTQEILDSLIARLEVIY